MLDFLGPFGPISKVNCLIFFKKCYVNCSFFGFFGSGRFQR